VHEDKSNDIRELQPPNVVTPIVTNPAGKFIEVKLVHALNKLSANAVICDGIVML